MATVDFYIWKRPNKDGKYPISVWQALLPDVENGEHGSVKIPEKARATLD